MASGSVSYTVPKCMYYWKRIGTEPPQFFVQIPDLERRKVFYKSRNTAGREKRREGMSQMSRWSRQIAATGMDLRLEEEIKR